MTKEVRIRFACEIYVNVEGDTDKEIKKNALSEFESLPIFSADAIEHFADVVDVENVEDAYDGKEL